MTITDAAPPSPFPRFIIDRPEAANALDLATAQALSRALDDAESTGALGFIITSASPRTFCSGGDLKRYAKMRTKGEGVKANGRIRSHLENFGRRPLVIIAAFEGAAIGGGCELALACDRIIVGAEAWLQFGQGRLALTPGWGGASRLLKRVTAAVAVDWLLSSRKISSHEALSRGLVDVVTPPGLALTHGEEWLREITTAPRGGSQREVILAIKKLMTQGGRGEDKIFNQLWMNPAHRERLSRFDL